MPLSPTQTCPTSMIVVASRVSARRHLTLFHFSSMSATFFSHASFSILCFFFIVCLLLWLVMLANWVAPLYQFVIARVPLFASLPQISCSRLESSVLFQCRSAWKTKVKRRGSKQEKIKTINNIFLVSEKQFYELEICWANSLLDYGLSLAD